MVKDIIKDPLLLSIKSSDTTPENLKDINDLKDTLIANQANCVGMAANMIGIHKRFIAVYDEKEILILINPMIIKTYGEPYETEEGCLCHSTTKKTQRYQKIKLTYLDLHFKQKTKTFQGFTAQIIQHEIDHCNGILI